MDVNICSLLYRSECIKLNILIFPFPPAFSCFNLINEASMFCKVPGWVGQRT